MSSNGTVPKQAPPAVVIIDSTGVGGPWLLHAMEMLVPAVSASIAIEFPTAETQEASVAFVVCDGGSPAARLAAVPPGIPATFILTAPDSACEEAALAAGAFDVLVLQDATPQDIRRAVQRMGRALGTSSILAERTRSLADSRKHIHDMNNSLATILAASEELLDNSHLGPEARRAATLIFDAARNAAVSVGTHSPAVEASVAPASSQPAAGDQPRILVIEDQPDLGRLVSLTLRARGYDVLLAQSADEAVALARQYDWQIAVVLSDIVMEGRSTREAVAEVRQHAPTAGVVFMSAYAPEEFFASGDIPEDAHFLQKPFTAAELTEAMQTAISS